MSRGSDQRPWKDADGYCGAITTFQPSPPLAAEELVATGTEREVLEAFLDFHHKVLVREVSGVSEYEARDRRVPSTTALTQLEFVEIGW